MMKRLAFVIGCLAGLSACTGGYVTENGQAVPDFEATVHDCCTTHTMTATNGIWLFNPYSPDDDSFTLANYVVPGPVLLDFRKPTGEWYVQMVDHIYDDNTCTIKVNGVDTEKPCAFYNSAWAPQSAADANGIKKTWREQCFAWRQAGNSCP